MGTQCVVRGICAACVLMVACVASTGAAGKLDDKLWAPREGFALLDPAGGGTCPVFSRGLTSVNVSAVSEYAPPGAVFGVFRASCA
jgi:hypothetical protein